ncbi:LysR family transcriptional regulator [Herbaspirillum sp. LeCh32-8]|uniref:LysR family transcriptional regulator n=1 Tax=Herbaspirillum sp. LeCh32-8 TaxID=2821356 RepID=UPI001AE6F206|nr:LysR family transcriptional regulator [Herbaspirillum sp. LeCh32-8]MBP0599450.1 LysR family transcriptional regulator [Herbaspirillum sp. LeCh32-8]
MDYLPRMAIFARVVELGAFSRAATELGLTASAVSQHIRALEESLGSLLLHRSTRKLSLTEAGRLYYHECVKVVRAAREGRQKVAQLRDEPVGELRVAVSSFMSCQYLIPALQDFISKHPRIKLSFDVSDHDIDLIEHRIDLALRIGHSPEPHTGSVQIAHFQDVLCAAPAYLDAHAPIFSPADLPDHEFLQFTPQGDAPVLELVDRAGRSTRVRVSSRISANHAQSLQLLAVQGHGVARLLRTNIQKDLDAGRLRLVLPQWRMAGLGAYLVVPRREQRSLKVQRCIEHIRAYFERQPEFGALRT